jgi:hypothetical protein
MNALLGSTFYYFILNTVWIQESDWLKITVLPRKRNRSTWMFLIRV